MISKLLPFALMLALTGAAPQSSLAADPDKPAKADVAAPAGADAKPEAADRSLREQEIYIPYEKLRQVFEKNGRGVFLPYEKFDELWRAAQDKTRPATEPTPPIGAVITEIESEATVSTDVVRVEAHLKIDLLTEGWHEVPLRLADAALVRATIKGQPARILGASQQDHRLLIEKKGKQPEQIELTLEYAKAITRSPGKNSVSIQAPQAPVSRWKVRIPQAGVKVDIEPLIAATEVPVGAKADDPAAKPPKGKSPDETVIMAFVGAAPTVGINWTPKSEGATGLTTLASVEAEQQVWVQEEITRIRTNLTYSISRAELPQLAFEVPADYKVVNVFDPNIRQWTIVPPAAGASVQRIDAQLFEPAKKTQQVTIELEKIAGQHRQDVLKTPIVKALSVGRQQGFVVVQVASGLRAEASHASGLLQVDPNELPPGLRSTGWTFSYRYATVPFELDLAVEEVQPRITADMLVKARIEPERMTFDTTAIYNIEKAGIFKLELDLPEGFEVSRLHGREIPGDDAHRAAAVEVDSNHLEGAKKNHLVVNLSRKALGRVALSIQLQKELHDLNLLSPTDKAADIALPLPQISKNTVERVTGRLVVYATESLRVDPSKSGGLRSVSFEEALEGLPWASSASKNPDGSDSPEVLKPALAFTYTQEPTDLELSVKRQKPQVEIRQMLVARIEEGVIKYQATFNYTVKYSGVKSLRIDVPADVAATLRNTTPGIRERTIDPPPPDLAKGMVAWSLSGDSEIFGEGKIDLVWEKKIDKLEVGKAVDLIVPRLIPRDVDRAWGQIVLAKAETLDVREKDEPPGLLPIDPQHDLATPVSGGARAFMFQGDWTLPITITRYELEDVKRTSIDRAVARMVITPAGVISVQTLYRIRTARSRLPIKLPTGAAFDSDPLRINGQPAELQQGKSDQYYVPIAASSADEPFLMELRYTVPGGRSLELPSFQDAATAQDDTAVQKVYLCAFIPATQTLLGTSGSWAEEYDWTPAPSGQWVANNARNDVALVSWVREGIPNAGTSADSFPTDGSLYVFSTLRPAADGSLTVRTMDSRFLSGSIFAIIALAGVLLLGAGAARRVLAIGVFIVLVVLSGVFVPTFARQLLNGTLFAAISIVFVLWAIVFVFRIRAPAAAFGRGVASRFSKPKVAEPPPPPEAKPFVGLGPSDGGPSHE